MAYSPRYSRSYCVLLSQLLYCIISLPPPTATMRSPLLVDPLPSQLDAAPRLRSLSRPCRLTAPAPVPSQPPVAHAAPFLRQPNDRPIATAHRFGRFLTSVYRCACTMDRPRRAVCAHPSPLYARPGLPTIQSAKRARLLHPPGSSSLWRPNLAARPAQLTGGMNASRVRPGDRVLHPARFV